MSRISLKITGAQGQGVNSVGEICGKGLKKAGYCVFGYREYMSLIKGGHSSYQLDISDEQILSSETKVDVLVNFNHHGLEDNYTDVKKGGVILHQTPMWKFDKKAQDWLDKNKVTVVYFPVEEIIKKLKAPNVLGNMLITSAVWTLLGQPDDKLRELAQEQFGHKGDEIMEINYKAIEEGTGFVTGHDDLEPFELPKASAKWQDQLYLTGSVAMGLGLIHGGCRMYCGYPMTPASPLLTYIADKQNQTGMVVKQAEDEITAAQMMSGAMAMGTRAATGTSGGGFDLMTESVSMNAIMESPALYVLAQRPGPATGLPTWTSQGDLMLAVGSAHGEFTRLVMAVSESQDAFDLMPEAFNYAEEYQIPVIVMTDKQIAEGLYTQASYDQSKAKLKRGKLVTSDKDLAKLKEEDRYDPAAKDGVSARWLPGAKAVTHVLQSDEHDATGSVDESGHNAKEQMDKRMKKFAALKKALPEPELFGAKSPKYLLVGWGSTKGVALDALKELGDDVGYLHYSYLWPLKAEHLEKLAAKAKQVVLIEGNYQGQLGKLIKMESGLNLDNKVLKYDGRPFFTDELVTLIKPHLK